jgi:proline iminopeptidase
MFQVSKIHTIAYFTYGNIKGKPVLVVHGGPGAGTTPKMSRFFNPTKYYIILVDQRGCGKSLPFGEIKNNKTVDLIEDFEKIRKKLCINKWMIFGGSWGSTLSLAYSMKYPQNVTEIILRGIFLIRKKEIDWVNSGKGANYIFPDAWKKYKNNIPIKERKNYMKAYGKRLYGKLGEKEQKKSALAWSMWEGSISHLIPLNEKDIKEDLMNNNTYIPISIIEHYYFINGGFFPREGYLLEDKNINKIKHLPIYIVQGQYDIVCPITSAFDLYNKLPNSEFNITLAGHSAYEPENIRKLVEITNKLV